MSRFNDLPLSQQRALIQQAETNDISKIISTYDSEHIEQSQETPSPADTLPFSLERMYKSGGRIHIKPQNRGKFTALKKRTGHSASWFKAHGTPAQKKMAVFALNARKWKHADGGPLGEGEINLYELETSPDFVGPPAPRDLNGNILDFNEMKRRQRYAESAFNDDSVSRAGAVGRYQVTPITLKEYEQRTGKTGDLTNPKFNEEVRDWYMKENLGRYNAIKRGTPTPYVDAYRRYVAYNEGPVALNSQLDKAAADGIDIDTTLDWKSYVYPEARDYADFIVERKDIPNTSKTASEYERAIKNKNIRAFGGNILAIGTDEYPQTPEGFAYVPEIQDEIVATPKINLSKGWAFNRDYYNQMVDDIMAGNDPLINRSNYDDIYFSGRRRAGRKLKKAIAKADAKQTKLDNEAWQEQQQKQYRDYIINGLRNHTLTPEEFGGYVRYGIDKYGVPIAAPLVGGAVLGAAAPVFGEVVGALGKYVPAAMDYSFNPVGAGLRTMIKNAPAAGATTVAGMSIPTASAVATATDLGLMSVYGSKALDEMRKHGVSAQNATELGMSVIPALGVAGTAAARGIRNVTTDMPSFGSLFLTSEQVGGNGITPWKSYMSRQVLNPNSFYAKWNPQAGLNHYNRRLRIANDRVAAANLSKDSAQIGKNDISTKLRSIDPNSIHSEIEAMNEFYGTAIAKNSPRSKTLSQSATTGGYSTEPLTYTTNEGQVVTRDVPVFTTPSGETLIVEQPEVSFPAGIYSPAKPDIGVAVRQQTRGYGEKPIGLAGEGREDIRVAVQNDMANIKTAVGDKGVWGGSAALAEKYGIISPGDADLITTEKYWPEVANGLGFDHNAGYNSLGAPKGDMRYAINGNKIIDADILEAVPGDPTKSKGKLANEFYSLLHPEEYVRLRNERAIKSLSTSVGDIELPISPEELLAEIQASPDVILKKTVMDNIISGRFKHIARMKSFIDFDPKMMSSVIEDIHNSLYGERLPFSELYPNMKFDNVEANKKFLSALHLPDVWANDPDKMRAATELLDASLQSVVSGKVDVINRSKPYGDTPVQWIERLVDSGTSTNNAAGAGANAVQGSTVGGDTAYSKDGLLTAYRTRSSFGEENIKTPEDLYNAFVRQTNQDIPVSKHFTSEQLSKAEDVAEKYLGKGYADLKGAQNQEQLYAEINDLQDGFNSLGIEKGSTAMKELAEALDLPAVRSTKRYFNISDTPAGKRVKKGGYVGSFDSQKNSSGKPVYGMEVSAFDYQGEIETPRVFTNADLYEKSATAVNERFIFQEREATAENLKALFESRVPDATSEAKNNFATFVDDLEKNFASIRASAEKAVKDLEASGVNVDTVGFDKTSSEWNSLSEDAKKLIETIDIYDPTTPPIRQIIKGIKDWKKFEEFDAAIEEAARMRDAANAYGNTIIEKFKPYRTNKDAKDSALRTAVLTAMAGIAGVPAGLGVRELSDRNFYKDDDFTSYYYQRSREENPYPQYLTDTFGINAKSREERKKEMKKKRRKEYMAWEKENYRQRKAAHKDYASISRALREYEKDRNKK